MPLISDICAMKEAVLVVAAALVLTRSQAAPGLHEWTDFMTKVEQVCMNQTGIDKTVIDRTKVTLEVPDDPQYKKYISCFYKKHGYQNEDGDIVFYNIRNMIADLTNATLAADIINACKDFEKQSSHEEYAYTVAKCLLENSKQKIRQEEGGD